MVMSTATSILAAGHTGEWGPGGWWFGPFIPLLWIAVIAGIFWLFSRRRPQDFGVLERARGVLAERFARGELSTEEYRERLSQLK
jgi:putative membrane protein